MTKPYRIKHKASGYFYQRYNGSNLGKKGKVYMNNQSPLTMCDNEKFIRIQIRHNTLAYKALRDMLSKYVIGKDDECEWNSTSYRVPKSEFEKEELQCMKSIFSMFAYWDRVHQFPDGHIKVENNLAWRRKHMHFRSSNKKIPFQRMKKETRNVVVLDWEDKIKLQQFIEDLEQISETYQSPCKELTGINNTIYYLKTIEEAINQRMKLKKIE